MKRQFLMTCMFVSLLVGLTALSANAQSGRSVTIDVPFKFVVDGEALEPGKYTIGRLDSSKPEFLMIKRSDGRPMKMFRTHRVEAPEAPEADAKLVFNRHRDEYFLSEVWIGSERNGRRLPRSEAENELRRRGAKLETMAVLVKAKGASQR